MLNQALRHIQIQADVCVVGGGVAGLCAALASARRGARTVILQDRPMFGGNASSEVRMWICGARGANNKETGILEELQLENAYYNPEGLYPLWDAVLHAKAARQPNLEVLLNCSCLDARVEGGTIRSVTGWQLTTQTFHTIEAQVFIDCSGDSILAPLSGAACRWGREASAEFNEDIEPEVADRKTMGNSILLQLRRTDQPHPFIAPPWAYRFESSDQFAHRMRGLNPTNFWWIEVGGLQDTIHDAEIIRDELLRIAYGVWDYLKNVAPERDKAACWELAWVGNLPGKRENRRYEGDHILTQGDIESGGVFDDVVAYGGWPMDDHHPAGMMYPGEPTQFHGAPSPYGIPYRCLYSRNIDNLLFAGRNISTTHAALSSTRVMGTCALVGQAVGTAAALAVKEGVGPRAVGRTHLAELQSQLMEDDCFLPGHRRTIDPLARRSQLSGPGEGLDLLLDGMDRDRSEEAHAWDGQVGDAVTFTWSSPVFVGALRGVFDSGLSNPKHMPCAYPAALDMPASLVRALRVEVQDEQGEWSLAARLDDNHQRLVRLPIERTVTAIRVIPEAVWGKRTRVRIFGLEPTARVAGPQHLPINPGTFAEACGRLSPDDLEPPRKHADGRHMVGA